MSIRQHRQAAEISMQIMEEIVEEVKIGVSGKHIDELTADLCKKHSVAPAFYGVGPSNNPFPSNLCLGVNEQILHSIPTDRKFKAGDLVKIDFGIIYKGYYTDHCITIGLEPVSKVDKTLMKIGKLAVESAVEKVRPGVKTGELGHIMQTISEMAGFNVLKNYVGHGIGKTLWQEPEIPAYGEANQGKQLKKGDVVCIEAQVVAGNDNTSVLNDKWTIVTDDGKKGVMYEYMVEVGAKGPNILTDTRDWAIFK